MSQDIAVIRAVSGALYILMHLGIIDTSRSRSTALMRSKTAGSSRHLSTSNRSWLTPQGARYAGEELIRRLLDRFTMTNPKAVQPKPNVCLIYKPVGMSLSDMEHYSFDDEGMPVDVVKGITMFLLAALDFLHSSAKLVHTSKSIAELLQSLGTFSLGRSPARKRHVLSESESSLDAVMEEELKEPSPRKIAQGRPHYLQVSRDHHRRRPVCDNL